MNLKEVFDAVAALPRDPKGYYNITPGHAILYVFPDGRRFDVIDAPDGGEYKEFWAINYIDDDIIECVQVDNDGSSSIEKIKVYEIDDDLIDLPFRIVDTLRRAGVF